MQTKLKLLKKRCHFTCLTILYLIKKREKIYIKIKEMRFSLSNFAYIIWYLPTVPFKLIYRTRAMTFL